MEIRNSEVRKEFEGEIESLWRKIEGVRRRKKAETRENREKMMEKGVKLETE